MTFADFILQHEGDDPVRLLLSRGKFPDIDLDLAVTTLQVRRRLRTKVPEWYAVPSLIYPSRLSGEQCSSSETARYKARVAAAWRREEMPWEDSRCSSERPAEAVSEGLTGRELQGDNRGPTLRAEGGHRFGGPATPGNKRLTIADLTGGMGVDAWAFAQVAGEVLYNEMQAGLARATELNFKELGIRNVQFRSREVTPGKVAEVLDGFAPDVIYLDPARRAEDGRKVFLIEDCRPDVLRLLPELFAVSRFVLLKLSPMADITMACRRLAPVREVHAVAADGECKELLFLLDREWEGAPSVLVAENGAVLEIPGQAGNDGDGGPGGYDERRHGRPDRPSLGLPEAGQVLFEPGKALLKAGAFDLPCRQFGLTKLGIHTHLYAGEAVPQGLTPFGKWFDILEVLPLNNRTMKETGKRYPQAEVTARNIPMTSDLLRRKTGCTSGGDIHLFGVRADGSGDAGNYLLICRKTAP